MTAKKLRQWLSIIALILVLVEIFFKPVFTYGTNFNLTAIILAVLLLAISELIEVSGKK